MVDYDEYVDALSMPKGWGSPMELDVISRLYKVEFLLIIGPEKPLRVTDNGYEPQVLLCVTNDSFYETVYTKSHIDNLGFCQSIAYRVLYEVVYNMPDVDYAVNKMLHDKTARAQRERYIQEQGFRDDYGIYTEQPGSKLDVRKVIDSGAILFPYKVAKALDADIYRNISFDVWVDSTRVGRRSTFWYGNGGPLRVGGRCQVRIENRVFTAFILDMAADRGPALVYVEELSQKRVVEFNDLMQISRASLRPDLCYKYQMIKNSLQKPDATSEVNRDSTKDKAVAHDNRQITLMDADSTSPKPQHTLIQTPYDQWKLVDRDAHPSVKEDFSDLPTRDPDTLQFFYNLGIEFFRQGLYVPKDKKTWNSPAAKSEMSVVEAYQGAKMIKMPPQPVIPPPVDDDADDSGLQSASSLNVDSWNDETLTPAIIRPQPPLNMCPQLLPTRPPHFPLEQSTPSLSMCPPLLPIEPPHFPLEQSTATFNMCAPVLPIDPPHFPLEQSTPTFNMCTPVLPIEPPHFPLEQSTPTFNMCTPVLPIQQSPQQLPLGPPTFADSQLSPPPPVCEGSLPSLLDIDCPPPCLQETPHIPREGKERRGTHKFVKPPRFQRRASALKAADGNQSEIRQEDVQVDEITSTSSPEQQESIPVTAFGSVNLSNCPPAFLFPVAGSEPCDVADCEACMTPPTVLPYAQFVPPAYGDYPTIMAIDGPPSFVDNDPYPSYFFYPAPIFYH